MKFYADIDPPSHFIPSFSDSPYKWMNITTGVSYIASFKCIDYINVKLVFTNWSRLARNYADSDLIMVSKVTGQCVRDIMACYRKLGL